MTNSNLVTFTKIDGKWGVKGPREIVKSGFPVTVTKANGTTKRVYLGKRIKVEGEVAWATLREERASTPDFDSYWGQF